MKNLTWQNPEQLFVAQELINKVKSKCCGIKVFYKGKIIGAIGIGGGTEAQDREIGEYVLKIFEKHISNK